MTAQAGDLLTPMANSWASAHDGPLSEAERCRRAGISLAGKRRLVSLLAERSRTAWETGDLLVQIYGSGSSSGVADGSRVRLALLAEEVGCSTSWLVSMRNTAGAWPLRERRSVSWAVHSVLRGRPDRLALLDVFVRECERAGAACSVSRLESWLAERFPVEVGPRLDRVGRLERSALRLPPAELEALVTRLLARLQAAA